MRRWLVVVVSISIVYSLVFLATSSGRRDVLYLQRLDPPLEAGPPWRFFITDARFLDDADGRSGRHVERCPSFQRTKDPSDAHLIVVERHEFVEPWRQGQRIAWFVHEPAWKWKALRECDPCRLDSVSTYRMARLTEADDDVTAHVASLPYVPITFAPPDGWEKMHVSPGLGLIHPGRSWDDRRAAVMLAMSNCMKWRMLLVSSLVRALLRDGVPVHLFGDCFPSYEALGMSKDHKLLSIGPDIPCPRVELSKHDPFRRFHFAQQKLCMLRHYRLALAIEGERDTDYISEKLFEPLRAGAVPIYLGAPNVEDRAPGDNCFINMEQHWSWLRGRFFGAPSSLNDRFISSEFVASQVLLRKIKNACFNKDEWLSYHKWRLEDEPNPGYQELERHSLGSSLCTLMENAMNNPIVSSDLFNETHSWTLNRKRNYRRPGMRKQV